MNKYDFNHPDWLVFVIIPLVLWSVFWKALGLWHAARKGDTGWYVFLVFVNTLGILEIAYLYRRGKLRPGKLFKK